ncbi:hypothetical protein PR003_g22589 [Phytophthora rubi]|uniref:Uncharacterized protein n=1 Tax=Phytophthora rubi TaxID=129364 RepID=A0A6A3J5C7_9STRA|nr:hypothetical protein PR001_g21658 [Phytophthora rubi]KAE9301169.1 hypothetical protein PR003_g22589 [Phytophthora rubi]
MRCSRAPACRASTGNAAAAAAAAAAAGRGGGAVVASSASFQVELVACKTRNSNKYEHPKKASKCTRGLPCTSSILLCLVRQCCCCRCSWAWWRCGCD